MSINSTYSRSKSTGCSNLELYAFDSFLLSAAMHQVSDHDRGINSVLMYLLLRANNDSSMSIADNYFLQDLLYGIFLSYILCYFKLMIMSYDLVPTRKIFQGDVLRRKPWG